MKKLIIATAALAAVTTATSASAQSASPQAQARANARLIKPVTLEWVRDLQFGTIVMGTVSGNQTVSIAADGSRSCGSSTGGLTCSDPSASAGFRVRGTQGQTVRINVPASIPMNGTNGGQLNFTPAFPATLLLANSSAVGTEFSVGGSIVINSETVDGVYSGQIDVEVVYQ